MNRKTYLVNFNLPFRVALNDSSLAIKSKDVNINIIWFKRNGVVSKHRNAILSKDSSRWINDDVSNKVIIEGSSSGQKYWIGEVRTSGDTNPAGYIDETIHGESAFHFLYSELFIYIQYNNEIVPNEEAIISQAIEATNKLIDAYRTTTCDINVFAISADDLEFVNLFEIVKQDLDIYTQKIDLSKIELRRIALRFNWQDLKAIKPFSQNFSEKQTTKIRQRVENKYRVPLWFEIFLEAKEQNFKLKNYNLAIVLLETGFEVFIDSYLRQQLKNKSDEEIDRYLEAAPFLNKLRQQIPKYLNKEIKKGVKEYDDWDAQLYSLRNKIVHEGFRGCSAQQVNRAFSVVIRLITYIDSTVQLGEGNNEDQFQQN